MSRATQCCRCALRDVERHCPTGHRVVLVREPLVEGSTLGVGTAVYVVPLDVADDAVADWIAAGNRWCCWLMRLTKECAC